MIKKYNAFTLVEISVVLFIISIILSCIYRGSEMLTQARLKSVIKDLYKYQTAFNLFKTQYSTLPGDISNAQTLWPNATTANGNGNGYIEYASGTSTPIEDTYVYQHLYLAGVLSEGFSGGLQSGLRKSTIPNGSPVLNPGNLPAAKYTNGTFEMFTETLYGQAATYLEFGSLINSTNQSANGPILTPINCNYIDKKIDDMVLHHLGLYLEVIRLL